LNSPARSLTAILVCGSIIVMIAMGVRHGLGLFLGPMSTDLDWNREVFSLAIALQNLLWGAAQPLAGGLADRYGAPRVIVGGALMYAAGLALMTVSAVPLAFSLSAGVLIGLALSGVTYSVIYGVVGRSFPEHKRSQAMGYIAAAGSFGQFLTVPLEQWLIGGIGWSNALLVLGAIALVMAPMALGLREPKRVLVAGSQTIREALNEAFHNGSFWLLTAGYFVCGFQVVFIAIHLPAYLKDHGLGPNVAVTALALIGLFNIIGTWAAGSLGARPAQEIFADRHLCDAQPRDCAVPASAAVAAVGLFICEYDGTLVAVDHTADQRDCRRGVRRALSRDARRLRVFLTPDRQLFRRLAGRPHLRPHRQL
jgi:MFS family permease